MATMKEEKAGWFDKTITLRDAVAFLAFVFVLGQLYTKFQIVESQIATIVAEEEYMATKEELTVVEDRLRKWIDRMESRDAEILELQRSIFKLEVTNGLEN